MSQRGETWVHGNSAALQFPGGAGLEFTHGRRMKKVDDVPWTDLFGLREGAGIRFRGQAGNTNVVHFSIPTPALFPRVDVGWQSVITVDRISVYYRTPNNQIFLNRIELFDGPNSRVVPLVGRDRSLHGSHDTVFLEGQNAFLIEPLPLHLEVAHGAVIAVGVTFDVEGDVFFRGAAIHYSIA